MAWIELHQSLRDHRKVLQAADELDIPPAHMVGLLSLLWLWAIDNAEDGDLSRVTSRVISRAAQWDGDADTFVMALKRSALIDSDTSEIHDWVDYSGKLVEQRESKRSQNRERQQRFRDKQRVCSESVPEEASHKNNALISDSTVPYPTVPNPTVPIGDISPLPPNDDGDVPPPKRRKPSSLSKMQEAQFNRFWSAYPKKVSLGDAEKAWGKIAPDKMLTEKIIAAIAIAKAKDTRFREERFTPNPASWLNDKGWLNEFGDSPQPNPDASFDLSDIETVMRKNVLNEPK